jgi:hypothetical protein
MNGNSKIQITRHLPTQALFGLRPIDWRENLRIRGG